MSVHHDKYQTFATLLNKFRLDATTNQADVLTMRQNFLSLQQFFQQEILSLVAQLPREQSYKTEISKQLRLLEIDVMFLQGARQATTVNDRLKAISDRLTILINYCNAFLEQESTEENSQ